ncbi:hypothetical protein ELH67_28315 (plasmid) [Rhizobium ruizarguesonis]|nr:hypothetical protein ELH67_28315 [Rhizobium ruizarguesonis]TBA33054.1 hypothetical protein ELH60_31785 [Rhizobium ruizarguesonis]TBC55450.1 hypothetical protein ELH36_29825 [Rhizobium ruizarguesonis]
MAIEHCSVSRCRRPFVNRATSYNLKHLPTGDKEDFTQYEQMISIEEYSFAVILYYRTLPKHAGIAASRNRTSRDRCLSTPGNRDHRSRDLIVTMPKSGFVTTTAPAPHGCSSCADDGEASGDHGQRPGRKNLVGMVCVASCLADR